MAMKKYDVTINYVVIDNENETKELFIGRKTLTTFLKKGSKEFKELVEVAVMEYMDDVEESLCDTELAQFKSYLVVEA